MIPICHWALADQPTRQSPVVDTKQDATCQTSYSLKLTCEFVEGREMGESRRCCDRAWPLDAVLTSWRILQSYRCFVSDCPSLVPDCIASNMYHAHCRLGHCYYRFLATRGHHCPCFFRVAAEDKYELVNLVLERRNVEHTYLHFVIRIHPNSTKLA
jgi:hypothetical protein